MTARVVVLGGFGWLVGALGLCFLIGGATRRRWTPPPAPPPAPTHTIARHGVTYVEHYRDGDTLVTLTEEADVTVTCAGYDLDTSWALAIDGLHATGPCPNCGDTLTTEVR